MNPSENTWHESLEISSYIKISLQMNLSIKVWPKSLQMSLSIKVWRKSLQMSLSKKKIGE